MTKIDQRSKDLRKIIVDGLAGGKRGHLGSSMSMVEIIRTLYDNFLNFNSADPKWLDRDRFILSKGHGCLTLYAILADKGFFPIDEMKTFCAPNSRLGGHPEKDKVPGVEASTGALGHGLSIGVGVALAAKIMQKKFRVVVLTGDGEINEGSIWEAALSASKHKLNNLTLIIDYNKLQSYGSVEEVLNLEPLLDKLESFGFSVREVDGHDVQKLNDLYSSLPFDVNKPSAIICHTIKGKGFPFAEGKAEWHHKSGLEEQDLLAMYACLK